MVLRSGGLAGLPGAPGRVSQIPSYGPPPAASASTSIPQVYHLGLNDFSLGRADERLVESAERDVMDTFLGMHPGFHPTSSELARGVVGIVLLRPFDPLASSNLTQTSTGPARPRGGFLGCRPPSAGSPPCRPPRGMPGSPPT
jgi:hypothetical protein